METFSEEGSPEPAVLAATPGTVRPRLDVYVEPGSREEARVGALEPLAPTIRVEIGRIEVRAITPPPAPPARRKGPARPGSALSLGDYLKQRDGGR